MAKRKVSDPPAWRDPKDGRSANRVTNEGVWDDEGRFWPLRESYLNRADVEALIGRISVGVQAGFGRRPEFFGANDGRQAWIGIRDHFADDGDLEGAGWPERVVYGAELLRRPDGGQLLWFAGQC